MKEKYEREKDLSNSFGEKYLVTLNDIDEPINSKFLV